MSCNLLLDILNSYYLLVLMFDIIYVFISILGMLLGLEAEALTRERQLSGYTPGLILDLGY